MRWSDRPRSWNLIGLAAVVFLAGVVTLVLLADHVKPDTVGYEFAKGVVQFLTVSLLGASVAFVAGDYQRRREAWRQARDQRDAVLRDMARETSEAYRTLKKARRVLRAAVGSIADSHPLPLDTYDAQLDIIDDVELKFEDINRTLTLDDPRVNSGLVSEQLKAIEDYIHELVNEYNANRRTLDGATTVQSLEKLYRFLEHTKKGGNFPLLVSKRFHDAQKELRDALLRPFDDSFSPGDRSSSLSPIADGPHRPTGRRSHAR